MSDVLLINSVIREFAPPNNVPLGLLYIASYLEEAGHNVDICDLNALRQINPDREYWLKKYLKPYDFIGLSGLIVTYQEQRRVLDFIIEHDRIFGFPTLISGGGLATSVPDFTFDNMPELDLIVIGEGEKAMLDIVDEIADDKYEGSVINGELIDNLDELPFPAWDKVPVEEVYLKNPIWGAGAGNSSKIGYQAKKSMNMIMSRGCPYNCNFCSRMYGRKYRLRSVDNVIEEIYTLKKLYDVDFVGFVDDNTTASFTWVLEFCDKMIKAKLGVKWGGSARVDALSPELLTLMKQSGCEWLGFGVESASPEILERMNKKATPEQAAKAIKMTRDAGIYANCTFIAGYTNEKIDDLRETAKFMRENDCLNSIFFATPYPQTQLYTESLPKILEKFGSEDNYIKSLADATDFKINLSQMSDSELQECRLKAMKGELF